MSLTEAQIDSLNKRDSARWEKACCAVTDAEDRITQIKDDIANKKKELDKLNQSLGKAKESRENKKDGKRMVAEELKDSSQRRASKRSPAKAKTSRDIDD